MNGWRPVYATLARISVVALFILVACAERLVVEDDSGFNRFRFEQQVGLARTNLADDGTYVSVGYGRPTGANTTTSSAPESPAPWCRSASAGGREATRLPKSP